MLETQTHSPVSALMDLARSGVTDIVCDDACDWSKPIKAKASDVKPVPTPILPTETVAPIVQKVAKNLSQPKVAETVEPLPAGDVIWSVGEAETVQVIVSGDKPESGSTLNGDAHKIMEGMLRALQLPLEETGYIILDKNEALTPAQWHSALNEERAEGVHVLALGEQAAEAVTGEKMDFNTAREWAKQNGVCITFHPQTLAMQPVLKRLAWQDMLAWQSKWEKA